MCQATSDPLKSGYWGIPIAGFLSNGAGFSSGAEVQGDGQKDRLRIGHGLGGTSHNSCRVLCFWSSTANGGNRYPLLFASWRPGMYSEYGSCNGGGSAESQRTLGLIPRCPTPNNRSRGPQDPLAFKRHTREGCKASTSQMSHA